MRIFFRLVLLFIATLFFSSCLYKSAPSHPVSQIDTWLLGDWISQDKSGKVFEATVTPKDNLHYAVTVWNSDKEKDHPWEFVGWISRVEDLKLLTLRSLSDDRRYQGKYLFFHYELLSPEEAPVNGVGARRMRLTALQLPASAKEEDPYHLRQSIRKALHDHLLLFPEGSSTWTRTGDTCWPAKKY